MTLLELVIACAILMILATAAMPVARFTVKRQKEAELHRDLREIRDAIDRYKDASDHGRIRVAVGTEGRITDTTAVFTGGNPRAQSRGVRPNAAEAERLAAPTRLTCLFEQPRRRALAARYSAAQRIWRS